MPQKVYSNVENHRVIDNDRTAEDITSMTLPTIEHDTTSLSVPGMAADVDMPNMTRVKAMECAISHNNGVNCRYLSDPGKHYIEMRTVRQKYDTPSGEMGHESAKFRLTCVHKSTDDGTIELGNPYGSTEKYSVLKYEKEINGEIVTKIDAMAGILIFNGKDYAGDVESLLS